MRQWNRFKPLLLLPAFGLFVLPPPARAHGTVPSVLPQGTATEPPLTFALGKAGECATCHAFPNPAGRESEPAHAPHAWQTSMMGMAARDPVFWAGVAIAAQDSPDETETCVRCHAPRAFWEGRSAGIQAASQLRPEDREGVSCDVCHRMTLATDDALGNATYGLDDVAGPAGVSPPKKGPWAYKSNDNLMHEWSTDLTLLADSRTCGACHDVTTSRERVDLAGKPMDALFGEQRTYSEWKNSAFANDGKTPKSCQDCHMPKLTDVAGCKDFLSENRLHESGGRSHALAGANRFVVTLMRDLLGSAGEDILPDRYFDATLAAIDESLGDAATLELEAAAEHPSTAKTLAIPVRVTNKSGHKLPTGYSEGRTMWIEILASYHGTQVFASGLVDENQLLLDDPQQRRYEAIAEDADNGERFHLVRNNRWMLDTRLPPLGLKPDPQTDPVGDRYVLGDDGAWPNVDAFAYTLDLHDLVDDTPDDTSDDQLEVTARLLYQINTPNYVDFLAMANTTNEAGSTVKALFDARGGAAPMELARASTRITLQKIGEDLSETSTTASTSSSDDDDNDDNDDNDDSGNETSSSAGCGCAASPPLSALSIIALCGFAGAAPLFRRRRS